MNKKVLAVLAILAIAIAFFTTCAGKEDGKPAESETAASRQNEPGTIEVIDQLSRTVSVPANTA